MKKAKSMSSPQPTQNFCSIVGAISEMNPSHRDSAEESMRKTVYCYTTADFEYSDVMSLMKRVST